MTDPLLPRSSAVSLVEGTVDASATRFLTVRLTDGAAFYAAGGGAGGDLHTQAKGVTAAGYPTSEATSADIQALHVNVVNGGSGGTASTFGAAWPAAGTAMGWFDGTNMQGARVFDADSGGGAEYVAGVMLRTSGAGGSTEIGTAAAPLRIDPTGATAQPVTGTFWQATQPVSVAALPLPAGAATDAGLAAIFGRQNDGTQHTIVDNASIAITAAALPLPAGAATEATLALIKAKTDNLDVALSTRAVTGLTDAQLRAAAVPVSLAAVPLPAGAATEATLATMLTLAGFQARINTFGQKTMANSTPVVLSSDQSAIPVTGTFFQATQPVSVAATVTTKETRSATGTQTSVAGSAANVTLLASNANRLGASIYNDSTAILYVRFAATATTSNFSAKLFPDDYLEVPFEYTGIIDGIWASATGNARVTEFT